MADILIRGMEMPKNCIDCPLMVDRFDTDACALQSQEANEAFESWDDMRRGCPLFPLPEGHGRLGDLDALAKQCDSPHWCVWLNEIQDAPTIVPGEGGTDNG